MTRPTKLLLLGALAAGLLAGCEPAPSTQLAPDKGPMPDASKLSPDQVDKILQQNHEEGRK